MYNLTSLTGSLGAALILSTLTFSSGVQGASDEKVDTTASAADSGKDKLSLDELRSLREKAKQRDRRLIYNNDGHEVIIGWEGPATAERLIDERTRPLVGSQLTSYFWSSGGRSFDGWRHNTKVGRIEDSTEVVEGYDGQKWNKVGEFIEQGTDALEILEKFAHEQGWEYFCSVRMNDTHDGSSAPYADVIRSPWKTAHPEYLLGTKENPPPYGSWTSVNYAKQAVRDRMFAALEEICTNYNVDGLELDFFRHLTFFPSSANGEPATVEELAIMTGFMERVRAMTEKVGMHKGKPILLAIRVPDSLEFNKAIGLDVEKWLAGGLIDLLIVSCYFKLNPWEYSVELGHKYGVKVYAGLSEVRGGGSKGPPAAGVPLGSPGAYAARAALAHQAGVDGIYMFNFYEINKGVRKEVPKVVGDPKTLQFQDKVYFDEYRGFHRIKNWIANGDDYVKVDPVCSERPAEIQPGESLTIDYAMADNAGEASKNGFSADARLRIWFEGLDQAKNVSVSYQGKKLKPYSDEFFVSWRIQWNDNEERKQLLRKSYKDQIKPNDGWLEFQVPPELITKGINPIMIEVAKENSQAVKVFEVTLWIDYEKAPAEEKESADS